MRQLVNGVTVDNFAAVGKAFIGAFGGSVIALKQGQYLGCDHASLPRQWGAWRAYFKRKGIRTGLMDARAAEGKPYTVPADWPHMFDAEASVADDYEAGDRFVRGYRPPRDDLASAAKRLMQVQAMRRGAYAAKPVPDTFQPYPALWKVAGHIQPSILAGHTFDVLTKASRILATDGPSAAIGYLKAAAGVHDAGSEAEVAPF